MRFLPVVLACLLTAACIKVPSTENPGETDPVQGAVACVALNIAADVSPATFDAAGDFLAAIHDGTFEADFPAVDLDFGECVPTGGLVATIEGLSQWSGLIDSALASVGLLALAIDTGPECANAWADALTVWLADIASGVLEILANGETAFHADARSIDFSSCADIAE